MDENNGGTVRVNHRCRDSNGGKVIVEWGWWDGIRGTVKVEQ